MSARGRIAARLAAVALAGVPALGATSPSAPAYSGQGGTVPSLDSPSAVSYGGQGGTLPRLDSSSGTAYGGQGGTITPIDPQSPTRDPGGGVLPVTGRNLELVMAVALALLGIGTLIRGAAGVRRRP